MRVLPLYFLLAIVTATASACSREKKPDPGLSRLKDPDTVPTQAEMEKILATFVAHEPRFGDLSVAFPGIRADLWFIDRKAKSVGIAAIREIKEQGGEYILQIGYTVMLDATLSRISNHKMQTFGARFVPTAAPGTASALRPIVNFPPDDLEAFCLDPMTYLRAHVPRPARAK